MSELHLSKKQLDTPTLWVDLDLLEKNIAALASHFKKLGIDWRPHTKGIKIPAIAHQMLAVGAIGITCAKLGEAEVMAAAGIKDILVANQIVGSIKVRRLVELRKLADVKVAVDSEINVTEIGKAAHNAGVEISVLVEVNVGMNRSGVNPGEDVVQLAKHIQKTPGVSFLGLMAWEGHTLVIDNAEQKKAAIAESMAMLKESRDLCEQAGIPVRVISGGGSGTYDITPRMECMTEIQAGGGIFSDVLYEKWGLKTTQCLFLRTIVTSRPAPERVIFDAGYKTMPAFFAQPRPIGIEGVKSYSASAEHGVMTLDSANNEIEVGDTFDFVIGYTDATLYLHDKLYGLRKGIVEVVWDVVGRGKLQ